MSQQDCRQDRMEILLIVTLAAIILIVTAMMVYLCARKKRLERETRLSLNRTSSYKRLSKTNLVFNSKKLNQKLNSVDLSTSVFSEN